jgi:4-methyl-5(b-hydroxyethyl)-thiazole monophosphate biosynthesis
MMLAAGFEDIEAVTPLDIFNRAGLHVTVASVEPGPVKAAYGVTILTDMTVDGLPDGLFDAVVLPGGLKNAALLANHDRVVQIVRKHFEAGRLAAAICASPSRVLGEAAGIIHGRRVTGDPAFNNRLTGAGGNVVEESVVVDGNLITAMGPGAALQFGLAIVEYLLGVAPADDLAGKWRISR